MFAFDGGSGSVTNVLHSPLLRRESVTFIDGPTQRTLPAHRFSAGLQFALLDGPHAYPFPDLEYYYLYPHLEPGALLVVDDIQIRSVHHLYEFLAADAMFRRIEVAGSTAFFERTEAPLFDPFADGWQEQNYNRKPLWRYTWRDTCAPGRNPAAGARAARRASSDSHAGRRRGRGPGRSGEWHGDGAGGRLPVGARPPLRHRRLVAAGRSTRRRRTRLVERAGPLRRAAR